MFKDVRTKDKSDKIGKAYRDFHEKAAPIIISEAPSGTMTPSQINRKIEQYAAKGIDFDLVVVDYADIMAPNYRSRDNSREDSKQIWLDLRAIAQEHNCAVLTATQTNRIGARAKSVDMTHVADDFNKIRTADLVISIGATDDDILKREATLCFVASRNQAGGTKMRIRQDRARMQFLTKVLDEHAE
jgi:replicative DNA helicase